VLHGEIGSDGSIYRTVADEAITVLRHWKKEIERLTEQAKVWAFEAIQLRNDAVSITERIDKLLRRKAAEAKGADDGNTSRNTRR